MRLAGYALLLTLIPPMLASDVPAADIRKTHRPSTKTHFRVPEFKTLADWQREAERLKMQILTASGLLPMPAKTPLNPRVVKTQVFGAVTVDTVWLETRPGMFLGGNLYRPTNPAPDKQPAMLVAHGHWKNGRLHNAEDYSGPALGFQLARLGIVAFAWDMVGYNDTSQFPHLFGETPLERAWAFGPLGIQLWNAVRALDYVSAMPNVDPERIGMTGASGGGTQTFLLAAIDPRIKVSVPVNMVSNEFQGGCLCENAPGLRLETHNVEIAGLTAPRPQFLIAATGDWTKHVPLEEFPDLQSIYRLYNAADKVKATQLDFGHNYNQSSRQKVYEYLNAVFFPGRVCTACEESPLPEVNLTSFRAGNLPAGAKTQARLLEDWEAQSAHVAKDSSKAELQQRIAAYAGVSVPSRVLAATTGNEIVLTRDGLGDRVEGTWMPVAGDAAVLLFGNATASAQPGESVLSIRLYEEPAEFHIPTPDNKHDYAFNRSADANRLQDALTALAYLRQQGKSKVRIVANGNAAVLARLAAFLSPVPVTAAGRMPVQPWEDSIQIPGILRATGGVLP